MKKTMLTSLFLLFIANVLTAQTIRRVNNNAGITGINVYTTIQAAHDEAVANDIISLEPSVTSYGSLDCRKTLKIIGNGYYLDKVSNGPQDNRTSQVSSITFNNGSAGSTLTGVTVTSPLVIADLNIAVSRCKLSTIFASQSANQVASQFSQGNNALINKCFIVSSIQGGSTLQGDSWVISNNIMNNCYFQGLKNGLVSNNTINFNAGVILSICTGTLLSNNIVDGRAQTGNTISLDNTPLGGNVVANNITLGASSTPTGSGNISAANATTTFLVTNPWTTFNTEDAPFKLKVGSPAIGVGFGGVDCGAYGNTSPYLQAGLPPIPLITSFLTSAIGNTTNPLTVNVAVRSNN